MTTESAPYTVLIVDDEKIGQETLEFLLAPEGYLLEFAANGEDAIAKAKAVLPDVVLLDVMMPYMDGFEVCARMRRDPMLAEVPIVLITALDERTAKPAGLESGADDYLAKPINRHELRMRLRNITRLNRYRKLLLERKKVEWVAQQAEEGYLLLNLDGRIHYANPAARRYLAIAETENLPYFLPQVACHFQCEPRAAWQNWPAPNALPRYLVRAETQDNPSLWLEVRLFQDEHGDANNPSMLALRNVSEHVIRQQKTRLFQDIIAHKLNTPLQALSAMDYVLAAKPAGLSEEHISMLKLARDGGHELQNRIARILQYVNEDRVPGYKERISANELLAVLEEIRQDLAVHFTYHLSPLLADLKLPLGPSDAQVIFREISGNSKKFHPHGQPEVEVRISQPNAEHILLQHIDNGIHLPAEVLEEVWTPYFQHEKFFTGQLSGMGLGLPIVASLIWSAGGTCHLRNREDQPGVVVEILLPCTANAQWAKADF